MASKIWRYNKDILLTIFAAVIIVLVVLLASRNNNNSQQNTSSTANSGTNKVSISPSGMKYPTGWQELSQINLADKTAGVVSEAIHNNPDAQVIIRINPEALAKDF